MTRRISPVVLGCLCATGALASGTAVDRVLVPAGPFQMGCSADDPVCEKDEGPSGGARVVMPAFVIDAREVTVAEYRACVAAGVCSRPKDNRVSQYCNFDTAGREDHPVNCVDWSQALAYCHWTGGRLPTEPEWEKAARAGSTTAYPWGSEVSCKEAILDEVSPGDSAREPDGCWTDATWPVASRTPNALGVYDMNGNAGEWTANWYAADAISALYGRGQLSGPEQGRQRVVRGGSWDENRPNLRSSFRNVKPPEQGEAIYGSIGFRCAADVRG